MIGTTMKIQQLFLDAAVLISKDKRKAADKLDEIVKLVSEMANNLRAQAGTSVESDFISGVGDKVTVAVTAPDPEPIADTI